MNDFQTEQYYKCIDGRKRKRGIIGYCHNLTHLGYVTSKIIEEHKCIEKDCPFLSKYEETSYWRNLENKRRKRKEYKQNKQQEKIYLQEINSLIHEMTVHINDFKIKDIKKDGKLIIITFYSCAQIDLSDVIEMLKSKLSIKTYFKRIKLSYAKSRKIIYPQEETLSEKSRRIKMYEEIKRHSIENQHEVITSKQCGCYYCNKLFDAKEVATFINVYGSLFSTALCPYCNKTTVIAEHRDYELSRLLINNMHQHYFKQK